MIIYNLLNKGGLHFKVAAARIPAFPTGQKRKCLLMRSMHSRRRHHLGLLDHLAKVKSLNKHGPHIAGLVELD